MIRLLVLFLLVTSVSAQTVHTGIHEKLWALTHPIAAVRVKIIYKRCMPYYQKFCSDSVLDKHSAGGSLDAFRHCFFMAAFAQKINANKIRRMGEQHEKSNLSEALQHKSEFGETADSVSCRMDLLNNDIGIQLGKNNPGISLDSLSKLVVFNIKQGNAFQLKMDPSGHFLDCAGMLIPSAQKGNTNKQKKCLVHTNGH